MEQCIRLYSVSQNYMDTTGKSLVEFWSWAAGKGLMNKNSASSLGAACSQVLRVNEDWENVDVTTIDADDITRRFKTLRAKDFKPKSLEAYEARFKKALGSFLTYVEDPGAWRATSPARAPRLRSSKPEEGAASAATGQLRSEPSRAGLVDYPFPLREGLTVRLMLPRDIKAAEVKRLNAFMSTLTVDFSEE
jgi:hypothetical protein